MSMETIAPEDLAGVIGEAAQKHRVEAAIHPKDFIFKFIMAHPVFPTREDAARYYFDDGARSAGKLAARVEELSLADRPLRILEFASGYGCVTRHLKKRFTDLVSCDIHEEALDFLATDLSVRTMPSSRIPEEFLVREGFDVVFALSFFSHLPQTTFGRWLKALFAAVNSPGALIFTTHGIASRPAHGNPEIPENGFWFHSVSEQEDLPRSDYGASIVTPEFVFKEVMHQTGVPVTEYRYAYWWTIQDLWIIEKKAKQTG